MVTPFAYSAFCHVTQHLAQTCCEITVQLVPVAVPVIKGAVHLLLLRGFGPNLNKQEELYKILNQTELMLPQSHSSLHVMYARKSAFSLVLDELVLGAQVVKILFFLFYNLFQVF